MKKRMATASVVVALMCLLAVPTLACAGPGYGQQAGPGYGQQDGSGQQAGGISRNDASTSRAGSAISDVQANALPATRGYVDVDEDGVCDNYDANSVCAGQSCEYGAGQGRQGGRCLR